MQYKIMILAVLLISVHAKAADKTEPKKKDVIELEDMANDLNKVVAKYKKPRPTSGYILALTRKWAKQKIQVKMHYIEDKKKNRHYLSKQQAFLLPDVKDCRVVFQLWAENIRRKIPKGGKPNSEYTVVCKNASFEIETIKKSNNKTITQYLIDIDIPTRDIVSITK